MQRHASLILIVLFVLTPAATRAKTEVELDEEADFAAFETYRWTQGVPAQKLGTEKQIHRSVNAQLGERGLAAVDEGEAADLDVATFVLTSTNVDLWSATATTQWGRAWSVNVRDITEGTLVIRITHGGTQDTVWHVMVHKIVEPGLTSAEIQRRVDRIIEKLFKKHYPRIKKK